MTPSPTGSARLGRQPGPPSTRYAAGGRRSSSVLVAAGLAAVVLAGCGGGATSVELAEPLSPEETKQLIGGMRTNWTEGVEARPSDPDPAAPTPR